MFADDFEFVESDGEDHTWAIDDAVIMSARGSVSDCAVGLPVSQAPPACETDGFCTSCALLITPLTLTCINWWHLLIASMLLSQKHAILGVRSVQQPRSAHTRTSHMTVIELESMC